MRKRFPHKSPGDSLGAEHVNDLSAVARALSAGFMGSGVNGMFSSIGVGSASRPEMLLGPWIVTSLPATSTPDIYGIKPRFYNDETDAWTTFTESPEFDLDGTCLNTAHAIDDVILVVWDEKRTMFVPVAAVDIGGVAKLGGAMTTANDSASGVRSPGSGIVQRYKLNSNGELESWGELVTVYNMTVGNTASTDDWIQYKVDQFGTRWWDVEDCTSTTS